MNYQKFSVLLSCVACSHEEVRNKPGRLCKSCLPLLVLLRCGHAVCSCPAYSEGCIKSLKGEETSGAEQTGRAETVQGAGDPSVEEARVEFTCRKCKIISTKDDLIETTLYMTRVSEIRRQLAEDWCNGNEVKVWCDHCDRCFQGDEQLTGVRVCFMCQPAQFFCADSCAIEHAQVNDGHEPTKYIRDQPVLAAVYNHINMIKKRPGGIFTASNRPSNPENGSTKVPGQDEPQKQSQVADENCNHFIEDASHELEHLSLDTSGHGNSHATEAAVHQGDEHDGTNLVSQTLDDIKADLILFEDFEIRQKDTVEYMEQLLSSERCLRADDQFWQGQLPGQGDTPALEDLPRAIATERLKGNVLIRTWFHQMILETLIHLKLEDSEESWQMMHKRLSLSQMQDWYFLVSEILYTLYTPDITTTQYVRFMIAPTSCLRSARHCYQSNLAELISKLPHSTDGQDDEEIILTEVDGNFVELERSRSLLKYENIADPKTSLSLRGFKTLEIAQNVFAVSRESEITLVRVGVDGKCLSQRLSPTDRPYKFGRGLWWNGESLYAAVVDTNLILHWVFLAENFIVEQHVLNVTKAIPVTPVPQMYNFRTFNIDDTIAESNDNLSMCVYPDASNCYLVFLAGSGIILDWEKGTFFTPRRLRQPRLLGVCGDMPNVILLDDAQGLTQTPQVYLFRVNNDPSTQDFIHRIDFRFKKKVILKDIWIQSDQDLCLTLETESGSTESVRIKLQ